MPLDCSFAHERTLAFGTVARLLFQEILDHTNVTQTCGQIDLDKNK